MRKFKKLAESISVLTVLAFIMFIYFLITNFGFSFVAMLLLFTTLNIDMAESNKNVRLAGFVSGIFSLIVGVLLHFVFGLSVMTCVILTTFLLIQYPFRRWLVVERKK